MTDSIQKDILFLYFCKKAEYLTIRRYLMTRNICEPTWEFIKETIREGRLKFPKLVTKFIMWGDMPEPKIQIACSYVIDVPGEDFAERLALAGVTPERIKICNKNYSGIKRKKKK